METKTLLGCGVALAAVYWLSQANGVSMLAVTLAFVSGIFITVSVMALTGGKSATNAKVLAEQSRTLAQRERVIAQREAAFNNEVLKAAKPRAEAMFHSWIGEQQATIAEQEPEEEDELAQYERVGWDVSEL